MLKHVGLDRTAYEAGFAHFVVVKRRFATAVPDIRDLENRDMLPDNVTTLLR